MKKSELKEMIKAAFMAENQGEQSADDILASLMGTDKDPYMAEEKDMDEMVADLYEAEDDEMLNEGIFDKVKDKVMSVGKKLLSKFAPEELESMKAAAEKVLGPNYSKEDITLDKAKEIGKVISGGLDESQELDENLRQKIGGALAGIGLPLAFIAGNTATTDAGLGVAVIGAVAAMIGMVMAMVDESQEVTEAEEEIDVDIDAKEGGDEEVDVDVDVDAEEKAPAKNDSIVIDKKIVSLSSLPGDTRKILDTLETLRAQAEEFGDQKFITQVGNTITFFTRDFVVAGDAPNPAGIEESKEVTEVFSDLMMNPSDAEILMGILGGVVGIPAVALAAAYAKDGIEAVKRLVRGKSSEVEEGDESANLEREAELELESLNEVKRMKKLAGIIK